MKKFFLLILFLTFASSLIAQETSEEKAFRYNDKGKRDPFWTLVTDTGMINNFESDFLITDLSLEGIMGGADGDSLAIINGRILKKNDAIGQFVVLQIDTNSVTLLKGQQEYKLQLKKEE